MSGDWQLLAAERGRTDRDLVAPNVGHGPGVFFEARRLSYASSDQSV